MKRQHAMKATKTEIQKRVEEILAIRLQGAEFTDIRQYASEQEPPWNVSDRQLWRYIQAGDRILADTIEKDRTRLFNRHIAQRRALYAKAIQAGDFRASLAIVQDEATLQGLYPAKRTELTGKDGAPIGFRGMTDEQLMRIAAGEQETGSGQGDPPTPASPR